MRIGKYYKDCVIGSGTYGTVYKAKEFGSNKYYAIKQIHKDETDDGIPSSTIKEIGILLEFRQNLHPNIVYLHEVIHRNGEISMVFEYVDYDLKRFHEEYTKSVNLSVNNTRNSSVGLPVTFIKSVTKQIMEAVNFCHQHKVMHRDIKPSNLLVTKEGVIKLADFGLSRTCSLPNRSYCHEVVTLWYRAPEIMLGTVNYSAAIDIWSVGCVIVELITGQVLFAGDSEIDQLFLIFRRFGTPNEAIWPGISNLPDYKSTFPNFYSVYFKDLCLPKDSLTLISTMLTYVPESRGTMSNLLDNRFVRDVISPIALSRILPIK